MNKLHFLSEVADQAKLEEESRSQETAHNAFINKERRASANKVQILLQWLDDLAKLEEESRFKDKVPNTLINSERRAHADKVHILLLSLREVQARLEEESRSKGRLPMMLSSTMREGLIITRYISYGSR